MLLCRADDLSIGRCVEMVWIQHGAEDFEWELIRCGHLKFLADISRYWEELAKYTHIPTAGCLRILYTIH
jgi:hypothetical protein